MQVACTSPCEDRAPDNCGPCRHCRAPAPVVTRHISRRTCCRMSPPTRTACRIRIAGRSEQSLRGIASRAAWSSGSTRIVKTFPVAWLALLGRQVRQPLRDVGDLSGARRAAAPRCSTSTPLRAAPWCRWRAAGGIGRSAPRPSDITAALGRAHRHAPDGRIGLAVALRDSEPDQVPKRLQPELLHDRRLPCERVGDVLALHGGKAVLAQAVTARRYALAKLSRIGRPLIPCRLGKSLGEGIARPCGS